MPPAIMIWRKTLGKKLNEYGNSTLFIFVDISGSRSVSDETIAEILPTRI